MTDDEIKRIQKRAKHVAKSAGYPEYAEDFAQEVFISILRGWSQPLDLAFIDFLRTERGSTRSLSGSARSVGSLRTISLDAPVGNENGDSDLHHDVIADPRHDRDRDEGHLEFRAFFRGRQATLYELYFVKEFSEAEIGEILGVTESRVSQLLKPIKSEIQTFALKQRLEQESDFGVFVLEWITL